MRSDKYTQKFTWRPKYVYDDMMISLRIPHGARKASDKSYREVQNILFVSYTVTKLCPFASYLKMRQNQTGRRWCNVMWCTKDAICVPDNWNIFHSNWIVTCNNCCSQDGDVLHLRYILHAWYLMQKCVGQTLKTHCFVYITLA